MEKNIALVIEIMRELKTFAIVPKFPRTKDKQLLYSLPEYIDGLSLARYLNMCYDLSLVEQKFVIDNFKICKAIQPSDSYIQIGTKTEACLLNVVDVQYGNFRIYGNRQTKCYDPKDMNASLTSYVCSYGVTAFVHTYKQGKHYVNSVYYSNKFDDLLRYVQLRTTDSLYKAYLNINNTPFVNGDYHETFVQRT